METILAGDIGGTNTRLMLFNIDRNDPCVYKPLESGKVAPGILILNKKYMNENFDSFTAVVKQFFQDAGINDKKPPIAACLAVAGPVKDNSVSFTNRKSWTINGDELSISLGIKRVKLINDFLAVGYGLLTLSHENDCLVLQQGHRNLSAPIACIGAGTGLGQCYLTPSKDGSYQCFPSEGGHAEFAPRDDFEISLLKFLMKKFNQKHRVSIERVISGHGLQNIYEFLCTINPNKIDQNIHKKIEEAGDLKAAIIATNYRHNELCAKAMDTFITAYGAEAGVAALNWLPFGGLYITGGMTPKNIDLIATGPNGKFMTAFKDKGRVSGILEDIPIYAVLVEDVGERGAHLMAYKEFQDIVVSLKQEKSSISSYFSLTNIFTIGLLVTGATLIIMKKK
jgi:glucokinase